MVSRELSWIMRDGSGQRVDFENLFTEAGVVHDLTGGKPSDRYAVLGGARFGVQLVLNGTDRMKYYNHYGQTLYGSRSEADASVASIVAMPLADVMQDKAPSDFPFDSADYSNLRRNDFAGYGVPYPWVYTSAIIAPVNPLWTAHPDEYAFPLREGLEPATLAALGQLVGIELVTAQE